MPRRTATLTVLAALTAVTAGLAGPAASAQDRPGQQPGSVPPDKSNRLIFTVTDPGAPERNDVYYLECDPIGGDHPSPEAACDALSEASRGARDPFRPVNPRQNCAMIDGGPATAHVKGLWRGREVDARFKRSNGCETARWDALVPALPNARA